MFKKILIIFLIFSLFCNHVTLYAIENKYYVKDIDNTVNETFFELVDAKDFYLENIDNYNNLYICENDSVIEMEYGVVLFPDEISEYYSISKDCNDYISGLYGQDGAYLKTEDDYVYFYINSDIGRINANEVILLPVKNKELNISKFLVKDNYLYHLINNDLNNSYYQDVLLIDNKLDYLNNNNEYYSYDSHYFYDDFYLMIDDYRNLNYKNSINIEPYYNYYQYLSFRSHSNYNVSDLKKYIEDDLKIDSRLDSYIDLDLDEANDIINKSQLYDTYDDFISCQNIYGTNSLMLLSSAIVESNYGKSLDSYLNNSLYSNCAYDSYLEKQNHRYNCISNCIKNYAKYFISNEYANHLLDTYSGLHYGNKLSGINKEYSLDGYYGEKCASIYFNIDLKLGLKDYCDNAIGIINNLDKLNIYDDEDLNDIKYTLIDIKELSFVILDELNECFKIQIDDSDDENYIYNFIDNVGYVDKDIFTYILNEENIHELEYIEKTFDFNEGSYDDFNSLDLFVTNDDFNIIPKKDGYEFIGYEDNIAQYKKINDISVFNLNNINILDITDATINITYEDGSNIIKKLNSDNLDYIDINNYDIQQFNIIYNGLVLNSEIKLKEDINNNIKSINELRDEFNNIKSKERNYVIRDINNDHNISMSGLDIGLMDLNDFVYVNDTYYVNINNCEIDAYKRLLDLSLNYGFVLEDSFNIDFGFNYQDISLDKPIIVSYKINNPDAYKIYSVYHLNKNGDVVKLYSSRSNNYVSFLMLEEGNYIVLSKDGFYEYDVLDVEESLTYATMGFDNHRINIGFMLIIALLLLGFIGITVYYIYNAKRRRLWKDYRKSLLKADIVQEEKRKN